MQEQRDNPPLSPCPKCGSKETEKKDVYYENNMEAEFYLYCIKCGEYLGHFSYGNWEY